MKDNSDSFKRKINERQSANRLILKMIGDVIEEHPDLRFNQILQNLGIVEPINSDTCANRYYTEPTDQVDQIRERYHKLFKF